MDLQLKGRTALVTGASAGIGTGIAECLGREGVKVALAGRDQTRLAGVATKLRAVGAPEPVIVTGDVTSEAGVADIAKAALGGLGGRIDILVNNAGGSRPLKGEETEEFWQEALELNFAAARRLSKFVIPSMRAQKYGRIINITGAMYGRVVNGAGPAKA